MKENYTKDMTEYWLKSLENPKSNELSIEAQKEIYTVLKHLYDENKMIYESENEFKRD